MPSQGEVWQIRFPEDFDRPGIVVSRNELNRGRLSLVVPCTASRVEERIRYPNYVFLPAGMAGLTEPTLAQTHLIQPVELGQFMWQRGIVDDERLGEVLRALAWVVDLYPE